MKRSLVVIALAAATLGLTPGVAHAALPDVTSGILTQDYRPDYDHRYTVHVNAQSYDGADARGTFFLDYSSVYYGTFKEHGTVTCHEVQGNRAVIGGVFREPVQFVGLPTTVGFVIIVNDEGEPGKGVDDLYFQAHSTPPTCPQPYEFEFDIDNGNVRVQDR